MKRRGKHGRFVVEDSAAFGILTLRFICPLSNLLRPVPVMRGRGIHVRPIKDGDSTATSANNDEERGSEGGLDRLCLCIVLLYVYYVIAQFPRMD